MVESTPFDETTAGTLHQQRDRPNVGRVLHVEVLRGPDLGLSSAIVSATSIGKSSACELRLTDESVSRRHLELSPVATGGLRLVDLSSTNGVYVNGARTFEGIVDAGAQIEIGGSILGIRVGEAMIETLPMRTRFGRIVGASLPMRALYAKAEQIASTTLPLLIEGETGTGKELLAEAIHEASPRASQPFVVFDCTTVSSQLLEASIFGHERGAFTGAIEARPGIFEEADGGTLMIDEIGDLDIALQAKLLRAAERQEVQRVGGTKWKRVDVRLISATRRDLEAEIAAGRFRDDLYYRIAVARVMLPPLRARELDVELIATNIWQKLAPGEQLPPDLLPRYSSYKWPGNVRELVNVVQRRFALGAGDTWQERAPQLSADGQSDFMGNVLAENPPYVVGRRRVIDEFERRFVAWALERCGGNVTRAANTYGIARRYLTRIKSRSA